MEIYYNLRQLGITNCVDRQLLRNAATLITKCVVRFYLKKCRNPYYKTRKLLQNVATLITKSVGYYKMPQNNVTLHNAEKVDKIFAAIVEKSRII